MQNREQQPNKLSAEEIKKTTDNLFNTTINTCFKFIVLISATALLFRLNQQNFLNAFGILCATYYCPMRLITNVIAHNIRPLADYTKITNRIMLEGQTISDVTRILDTPFRITPAAVQNVFTNRESLRNDLVNVAPENIPNVIAAREVEQAANHKNKASLLEIAILAIAIVGLIALEVSTGGIVSQAAAYLPIIAAIGGAFYVSGYGNYIANGVKDIFSSKKDPAEPARPNGQNLQQPAQSIETVQPPKQPTQNIQQTGTKDHHVAKLQEKSEASKDKGPSK